MNQAVTPTNNGNSAPRLEAWREAFESFCAVRDPERFAALFLPDAALVDCGLLKAIRGDDIARSVAKMVDAIPDLRITTRRHRGRGDTLFIECTNAGTLHGQFVEWESIYVATLSEGLASSLRCYHDHAEMLRPFLADAPPFAGYAPFKTALPDDGGGATSSADPTAWVEAYVALWNPPQPNGFATQYAPGGRIFNSGMQRPITKDEIPGFYQWVHSRIPDLRNELETWAGDSRVIYLEWKQTGTVAEQTFWNRVVDIFELDSDGVVFGRAYYDTLKIIAQLKPDVLQLRDKLFLTTR